MRNRYFKIFRLFSREFWYGYGILKMINFSLRPFKQLFTRIRLFCNIKYDSRFHNFIFIFLPYTKLSTTCFKYNKINAGGGLTGFDLAKWSPILSISNPREKKDKKSFESVRKYQLGINRFGIIWHFGMIWLILKWRHLDHLNPGWK